MSGNRQPGDMKHPVKSRYRHRHNPPSLIVPITKEMDDEKKIQQYLLCTALTFAGSMASIAHAQDAAKNNTKQPSRAQQLMGDIAPKMAQLTDDVLYADIWERPQLSKRDRSLVTVSALVAMDRPDQLRSHLRLARQNGVTEEELVEAITQLAFYSGWPTAVTAISIAKEVFKEGK